MTVVILRLGRAGAEELTICVSDVQTFSDRMQSEITQCSVITQQSGCEEKQNSDILLIEAKKQQ